MNGKFWVRNKFFFSCLVSKMIWKKFYANWMLRSAKTLTLYPAPLANIPPLLQYWGGVLGLLRWFGVLFFYQCIPGDVRACQGGLEHFFSTFVHLTERGGEDDFGNAHIEPSHFKKGLPLLTCTDLLSNWTKCPTFHVMNNLLVQVAAGKARGIGTWSIWEVLGGSSRPSVFPHCHCLHLSNSPGPRQIN